MKKSKLNLGYFAIISGVLLTACAESQLLESPQTNDSDSNTYSHSIDTKTAIANLEEFMSAFDADPVTRSNTRNRSIKSIHSIPFTSVATRSEAPTEECENLLYVVNFDNNEGYAIVAADDRIEEDIICVADSGQMNMSYFTNATGSDSSDERIMSPLFPTDGPGFFTMPELGDELLMNPNTVDFYNPSTNECYVGNMYYDQEIDSDSSDNNFSLNLCIEYAKLQISENANGTNGMDPDPAPWPNPVTGEDGYISFYGSWEVTKQIKPLLKPFESWSQNFNRYFPVHTQWWFWEQDFLKSRPAPAGCFNLAMAKIFLHHLFPHYYNYKGRSINLEEFKNGVYSEDLLDKASYLLWAISEHNYGLHFYQGTFVAPASALHSFRQRGYSTVKSHDYEFVYVEDRLDHNCPIIIYGMPRWRLDLSHAWNIDGYKKMTRTVTTKKYLNGRVISESTTQEYRNMVHCDLGFRGANNAYYVSGVFNSEASENEYDYPYLNRMDFNYTKYLHVITYDNPSVVHN